MEWLAHAFGFIRYRSTLHAPAPACCGSTDSPTGAEVYVSGRRVATLERERREHGLSLADVTAG
jgi:hypothetical protein